VGGARQHCWQAEALEQLVYLCAIDGLVGVALEDLAIAWLGEITFWQGKR
jgi:hypothetical protein